VGLLDRGGALVCSAGESLGRDFERYAVEGGVAGANGFEDGIREGKFRSRSETGLHHPVLGALFAKSKTCRVLNVRHHGRRRDDGGGVVSANTGGRAESEWDAAVRERERVAVMKDTIWRWRLAARVGRTAVAVRHVWPQMMDG